MGMGTGTGTSRTRRTTASIRRTVRKGTSRSCRPAWPKSEIVRIHFPFSHPPGSLYVRNSRIDHSRLRCAADRLILELSRLQLGPAILCGAAFALTVLDLACA